MKSILKQSLILCIILLLLCGITYPFAITGLGQILFNKQANGSLSMYNGRKIGSSLIGQNFTDPRFFHGRVSSINYNTYTQPNLSPGVNEKKAYNGVKSGSSNLAPSNKILEERIRNDINIFLSSHPGIAKNQIPEDLITSSGSGLDPDISVQAAKIQIPLISKNTGIAIDDLNNIIQKCTKGRTFGIFGEPRVNVLSANLEIAKKLNIK